MSQSARNAALFLAVMSVYSIPASSATPEKSAGDAVRLLDPASPVAATAAAAATPIEIKPTVSDNEPPQIEISETGAFKRLKTSNDAPLVGFLQILANYANKNIITSKEVRGTVSVNLTNVTFREALDAILKSNGLGYREKGNFIYVYTQKELAEIEKAERRMETQVFRLFYTPAANVQPMLKPALSADGQISVTAPAQTGIGGGGSGGSSSGSSGSSGTNTGGNAHATEDLIVIKDYPENLEKISKIIKEVDRRPQQILVEATILSARLTEDNALGMDFSVLGGVDFSSVVNAGTTAGGISSGSALTDAPGMADKGVGAWNSVTTGSMASGKGMRMGILSNNIAVFIQALEETTNTTILANPKLLALNKQMGEVLVGREDGYLTTTVSDTTSVQSVQFLQTGTKLSFRPYIGDDGFIRMEVHPEDSDGSVVSGLPSKTTTEVTSNIMVKDGHTIVIGGLFRESSAVSREQTPGLGNIPILGNLFRSQADTTVREEIIVLLTPHIIKDDDAMSSLSDKLVKDFEKLRVGVRKGMLWFGRERLAEGAYEKATAELAKSSPDNKRALWLLDCSTNLNPTFREAIELKQTLNSKEITAVDNASIHNFIRVKILADKNLNVPTEKNPGSIRIEVPAPTTLPVSIKPLAPSPVAPVAAIVETPALIEKSPATLPSKPSVDAEVASNPVVIPLLEESAPQPVDPAVSAIDLGGEND